MTNFYKSLLTVLCGACFMPLTMAAEDNVAGFMKPATLDYPNSYYTSMVPMIVDVTWDNEPIELIDPKTDDNGDDYVDVFVQFDEEEPVEAAGYVVNSIGEDADGDIWYLEIALYDIDSIWDFTGKEIVVSLPEGIVKNEEGLLNPAQDLTFYMMESYTEYKVTPESGEEISQDEALVKVDFGGNEITYNSGSVTIYNYDPVYTFYELEYSKEVTINKDNELVIDLSSLEPGDYEVVIPEGLVFVIEDGEKYINPDIWLEYTISLSDGVTSIKVNKEPSQIYNLNGVKMGNGLNNLTPGIYLINGKKVMVK